MASLVTGCVFFVGIHVVISGSPLRGRIVGVIGERPYLGMFSLLSIADHADDPSTQRAARDDDVDADEEHAARDLSLIHI